MRAYSQTALWALAITSMRRLATTTVCSSRLLGAGAPASAVMLSGAHRGWGS